MATIRLSRGENVSDFYDRITSLRLGAQAVLEDKYENANSHCLLLNDCALEAFIRGLPDRMSAFVESQYPNTLEIALKYALGYETKHQTNSQILQQQDNFDLRAVVHESNLYHRTMDRMLQTPHQTQPNAFKFKQIQALSTLSISVLLTQNTIPSHTCHCLSLIKTTYLVIKLITIQTTETKYMGIHQQERKKGNLE